MTREQKELLCAASDVLSSLSKGQLKRVLAGDRSHSICVRPTQLKTLHDAIEIIYPGLVKQAQEIYWTERNKARAELSKKPCNPNQSVLN